MGGRICSNVGSDTDSDPFCHRQQEKQITSTIDQDTISSKNEGMKAKQKIFKREIAFSLSEDKFSFEHLNLKKCASPCTEYRIGTKFDYNFYHATRK